MRVFGSGSIPTALEISKTQYDGRYPPLSTATFDITIARIDAVHKSDTCTQRTKTPYGPRPAFPYREDVLDISVNFFITECRTICHISISGTYGLMTLKVRHVASTAVKALRDLVCRARLIL